MTFSKTATFDEVVAATVFSPSFGVFNQERNAIINAEVNILQCAGNQEFCAFSFAFTERTEIFIAVNADDINALSGGFTNSGRTEGTACPKDDESTFTNDLLS